MGVLFRKKTRRMPAEQAQSWRKICQAPPRKPLTAAARRHRRRAWLRALGLSFLGVVITTVVAGGLYYWSRSPQSHALRPPSVPLRQVFFETDGVLKSDWLRSVMNISKGQGILDIDIDALKRDIESEGQVRSAVVERLLPDTLKVTVQERLPILRLAVRSGDGRGYRSLLVAWDGSVYRGRNYLLSTLDALPYLDGVRLERSATGRGVAPIAGMETVGQLLAKVHARLPRFYRTWKTVSCEAFDGRTDFPGAVIVATTRRIGKVVFAPVDFDQQIEYLAYTLEFLDQHPAGDLEYVDLSLGDKVAVKFIDQLQVRHLP